MARVRAGIAAAAALICAALMCAGAQAQDLDAAVSGFAVAPPPGYVARAAAPSSPSRFVIDLVKPGEPETGCEVSFEALPGFEQFSQAELNRQTERAGWEEFYREGLGAFYDVHRVSQYRHAGVWGALVSATSRARPGVRGWVAERPTMIVMLYTPKGLSKVACFASPQVFEARRSEFEAVVRGLTPPR